MGLALARCQHRHRRLVGMHHRAGQYLALQGVQSPCRQPDADAVMDEHLQAGRAPVGEDIRMVRPRSTEDLHHPSEGGIGARTHVHRLGAQPHRLDPDHQSQSRSQAAQSRAALTG